MKVVVTGANGYIGKRLVPLLLEQGYEVYCCVRDRNRLGFQASLFESGKLNILEIDFLKLSDKNIFTGNCDIAFYLIHSMNAGIDNFGNLEERAAENFIRFIQPASPKQIIYLSGISNNKNLSPHLSSRKNVENILKTANIPLTILRAGIIIGSGSASFEIMRDLVEKLPVMITPKWVNTKSQPIAIRNVLEYLCSVILNERTYNRDFDIGGPDILTYKEMLLQFAEVRNLRRYIFIIPIMTPRLSSYWLYFVTAVSYPLAVNLVNSMKTEIIGSNNGLQDIIKLKLITYKEAVRLAFGKVEQDSVVSSWKDAFNYKANNFVINDHLNIPQFGCYVDHKELIIKSNPGKILENIWAVGGNRGWYYADYLWGIRGFIDKIFGGVGLRRGRTRNSEIYPGDTIDFWRVLVADKIKMRLLLYAEMKLPGEAWLELSITQKEHGLYLSQTATFRPKGLLGRLYWYGVLPFHYYIFNGMIRNMAGYGDL